MSDYIGDITSLVNEEDIVTVIGRLQTQYPPPVTVALDFSNVLLYHLEAALEQYMGTVGPCHCGAALHVRDLARGYCVSCFGAITVNVSGKRVEPWFMTP